MMIEYGKKECKNCGSVIIEVKNRLNMTKDLYCPECGYLETITIRGS